jgi:hypothetical protein
MRGRWVDLFALLVTVAGLLWAVAMACGVDIGWLGW